MCGVPLQLHCVTILWVLSCCLLGCLTCYGLVLHIHAYNCSWLSAFSVGWFIIGWLILNCSWSPSSYPPVFLLLVVMLSLLGLSPCSCHLVSWLSPGLHSVVVVCLGVYPCLALLWLSPSYLPLVSLLSPSCLSGFLLVCLGWFPIGFSWHPCQAPGHLSLDCSPPRWCFREGDSVTRRVRDLPCTCIIYVHSYAYILILILYSIYPPCVFYSVVIVRMLTYITRAYGLLYSALRRHL